MTGKPEDEAWISDARALLDASAQQLDADTLARIAHARNAALRHARVPRWSHWRSWWMPLTGLAAACALVLALGLRQQHRADLVDGNRATQSGSEVEAAVGDETMDLTQDLEFYAWLEAREDGDG